jgi:hypothetical protein
LLFSAEEPPWGSAALIVDDWLYVYACGGGGIDWDCRLARVTLEEVLDRAAWRFLTGGETWSRDWKEATIILHGLPELSVHWNEYLGKYLATYARVFDNRIRINVADRPEGPWSEVLIEVETEYDAWIGAGLGHPEFAKDNGRVEYLTYKAGTGLSSNEIRLIEITFQ